MEVVDLKEAVNKFKIAVRDGSAELLADADAYFSSITEAKALRDETLQEHQALVAKNTALKTANATLEAKNAALESRSEVLRKAIASIASVKL